MICHEGWDPDEPLCPCVDPDRTPLGGYYCCLRKKIVYPTVTCPYAPILRALPEASEEQLEVCEAVLGGAKIHKVYRSPFLGGGLSAWGVALPEPKPDPCPTRKGTGKRRQDEV